MTDTLDKALAAARDAAGAAAEIIQHYWRAGVDVIVKGDDTPVTVADREAEMAIRAILAKALPEAGIYGEEYGADDTSREYLWLVDPLDGTKSFVRRTPFFSTQIALMHRGELVLGVSSAPIYGERMWPCEDVAPSSTATPCAWRRRRRCARHRSPPAT